MEAIEYLKLATDKTEAGDLIKENNLTEALVKLMDNYAEFRVKNCSIPDVSIALSGFMDWLWLNHNILTNADNNKIALEKYLATL